MKRLFIENSYQAPKKLMSDFYADHNINFNDLFYKKINFANNKKIKYLHSCIIKSNEVWFYSPLIGDAGKMFYDLLQMMDKSRKNNLTVVNMMYDCKITDENKKIMQSLEKNRNFSFVFSEPKFLSLMNKIKDHIPATVSLNTNELKELISLGMKAKYGVSPKHVYLNESRIDVKIDSIFLLKKEKICKELEYMCDMKFTASKIFKNLYKFHPRKQRDVYPKIPDLSFVNVKETFHEFKPKMNKNDYIIMELI